MSHVLLILFYLYFFPRISLLCARWLVTRHSSELKVKVLLLYCIVVYDFLLAQRMENYQSQ